MRTFRDRQRTLEQLTRHLNMWVEELSAWELRRRIDIIDWITTSPEGESRPITIGEPWIHRHGIHVFKSGWVAAPEFESTMGLELRLDVNGEAMVTLIGPDGTRLDRFGANPRHKRFQPVPQTFRIEIEAAARALLGMPSRTPHLIESALVEYEPLVRELRRRVEVLVATVQTVKDPELARSLCDVAEYAISRLKLPTATQEVGPRLGGTSWAESLWERSFDPVAHPAPLSAEGRASVRDAIAAMDDGLASLRGDYPKQGHVLVTGHAHIDYCWLWPQPETVRKITRTFNSVVSLMKSHPEFRFIQSSSILYEHIAETDPATYQEILGLAQTGQWEVTGGMYIECDTNMPSAEAFVRQFTYGQKYFQETFGQVQRTAWLPDTFGFTGSMPQILLHGGVNALVTIKVTWNETNPLPDNLFYWQGNDGSKIFVHTYNAYENDGYNMFMRPQALAEVWGKHQGKDLSSTIIATYGWGDGGGGPAPDQIEIQPILNLMPAIPRVEHGHIQTYLDRLRTDLQGAAVSTWSGELYLEYHRSTLTTQAAVKRLNRQAEYALVAAEAASVLSRLDGDTTALPDMHDDWKLMLRNQFHDILPGSSIREVYEQTVPELEGIVARAEEIAQQALERIAARHKGSVTGLAVANLSGSAKSAWSLESATPFPDAFQPQKTAKGWVTASNQPLAPLSISFVAEASAAHVDVTERTLENALVKVSLDEFGRLSSVFDKRHSKELLSGPGNQLLLYCNDLPRQYDAWDIEPGFDLSFEEVLDVQSITVTATGPHLGEITVVRRFGASTITQGIRLWSNSARVEFVSDLEWHDRRVYLRAAFPLNVMSDHAVFDQAIGVINRATHENTSWQRAQFEACGHRFVSLSEPEWGGALLSREKYGFSAKGNTLTISLARGPLYPDMLADEGHQQFRYALLPHDGRWWNEEVQAEADLFNDPLRVVTASAASPWVVNPVRFEGLPLRFHALKPAEDGTGYVLRASERSGKRGPLGLVVPGAAVAVNGLEEPIADGDELTPFHLVARKF